MEFPLCGDSERDRAIRPLVSQAVEFVVGRIGASNLDAVILTGSLARGEGSVVLSENRVRLMGDIEFIVILRGPFDWGPSRRKFDLLSRMATEEIGKSGSLAKIEYQPAGVNYLRRNIQPSIFANELSRYGKVVFGRTDILTEIRPFCTEKIPKEDALNLLMNRFIELKLLGEVQRITDGDAETHNYQFVKTILDMAGSALAFSAQHVPLYAERKEAFQRLLLSHPELRVTIPSLETFQKEVERATHCKLAPTAELLNQRDGLKRRVLTTLEWAKAFWLWEMRQLVDCPTAQFQELLEKYLRQEPFQQRLKGWVKFYIHPLRPVRTFSPARASRLLFLGSPQRLTYAAALMTHGDVGQFERNNAASLLPIPVQLANGTMLHQVGDIWRWLIRNN